MGESSRSRRYGSSRPPAEAPFELPLPLALILADELGRAVEERLGVPREVTHTASLGDRVAEASLTLLDVRGRGRVREAVLLVDGPGFDLYAEVDGRSVVNHSFAELRELSEVMEEVDAFERDGTCVVRLSRLSFLDRCLLLLRPRGRVTVRRFLAIYDLHS